MSLEHSPVRDNLAARDTSGADPPDGPDYWNTLVDEKVAAAFLGLTVRTVQGLRQRGDGPRYIRVSSRCIRYTRTLLKVWADSRLRSSTSDPGEAAA